MALAMSSTKRALILMLVLATVGSFTISRLGGEGPAWVSYPSTTTQKTQPIRSETEHDRMCNLKYPPATIEMLKRTLATQGIRRVAIIGNFRSCAYLMPSIEKAVMQVSDVLSPKNVFVSFLESGSESHDETPSILRSMATRLQAQGISNIISTGRNPITAEWVENVRGRRIDFLARIRNAAMFPAFYSNPVGHFDKFFFVNDVYICGGDILRLLAHNADIACGLDYNGDDEAVWDQWVIDAFDKDPIKANSPIKNVFACWNGGIASKASLFYDGIRFREGMQELGMDDCAQSECSLWSMDAHKMGYHNIVLDPSVQSAYAWSNYKNNFRDSTPEVKAAVVSPNVNTLALNLKNMTYRCCELTGSNKYIDWGKCHTRQLLSPHTTAECKGIGSMCLHYVPSRWEEDWDWKSLLRRGISDDAIPNNKPGV